MSNATGEDDAEVSCVAITVARSGYEKRVRQALENLIDPVRQEPGVIQYEMYRDPKDQRRFVFVERWDTMEHFEAHCVAPHIRDYLKLTEGWLDSSAFYALKKVR
jgi:quinol monooxygenase YgiN